MLLSKINPHLAATVKIRRPENVFQENLPISLRKRHGCIQFLEAALTGKRAKMKYMGLNKGSAAC